MNDQPTQSESYRARREEMRGLLREVARQGDTVSYSELGRMLREPLHHRNPLLYELLRDICYEEREAGRPNLCALVVRKSDGLPGKGFFEYGALAGDDASDPYAYWEAQARACWAYYADDAE
jgi:hypothetical protein